MKVFFTICASLMLMACASGAANLPKYFTLSAPVIEASADNGSSDGRGGGLLLLKSISVANYLSRASIALQLSENELYYSSSNLWAEPLGEGIERALVAYANGGIQAHNSVPELPEVTLNIDYFHIVDGKAVVLSGHYIIERHNSEDIRFTNFSFQLPLKGSGYSYGVSRMSELVKMLGDKIVASLNADA
ncbi:PqiC family protein [Halioxenophilus aromaticivorans]|uniref:ABC-type transport auxiliary lipoprotein component domain-containing protein n=1 Tax=Halioxenophilus aromaticivorans TaxID=1306992 RepID=A0AAV3U4Q6_9ALTE